jgi:hypothetical protein
MRETKSLVESPGTFSSSRLRKCLLERRGATSRPYPYLFGSATPAHEQLLDAPELLAQHDIELVAARRVKACVGGRHVAPLYLGAHFFEEMCTLALGARSSRLLERLPALPLVRQRLPLSCSTLRRRRIFLREGY